MTKKIIAFGASNSKNSINKKLATYTATLFTHSDIEILDLNDFEMPIYSIDIEKETGIPQLAHDFYTKIGNADLIIISLAEHNGSYSTAFKNIFDWNSRINNKNFQSKDMLLLSTSPGPRGGMSVFETAKDRFPRHDANIVGSFTLPSFNDNFSEEEGIKNEELKKELLAVVNSIEL